ncbi:hypothetical protein FOZ62_000981, partial [Perkinsus olseni]
DCGGSGRASGETPRTRLRRRCQGTLCARSPRYTITLGPPPSPLAIWNSLGADN